MSNIITQSVRKKKDIEIWKQFGDYIEDEAIYGVALELSRVNNIF